MRVHRVVVVLPAPPASPWLAQPGDRHGDLVVELAGEPPTRGDDLGRRRAPADRRGAVARRPLAPYEGAEVGLVERVG
jgi:hypothetical protein